VELDLHQQLALLAIKRFGPRTFEQLLAEVGATRPTTQAEMANAVLKMEAGGVIDRPAASGTPHAQRPYVLTRRGKRILRYIPSAPRSAIEFYV
jgi:hypothetical protein